MKDGETGYLAGPHDPELVADRILRLWPRTAPALTDGPPGLTT